MKTILLINEGSKASVSDEENTISHYAIKRLCPKYDILDDDFIVCQSGRFESKKRMIEFLKSKIAMGVPAQLKVVTASYGCVQFYRILKDAFLFSPYYKIDWLCIDGFSLFPWGFGANKRSFKKRKMPVIIQYRTNVYNFYQKDNFIIKGAKFKNTRCNVLVKNSSHAEIRKTNPVLAKMNEL